MTSMPGKGMVLVCAGHLLHLYTQTSHADLVTWSRTCFESWNLYTFSVSS